MIIFLIVIILVLAGLNYYQYSFQKHRSKDLKYIADKLKSIMENNTSEKLLVFTDDKELKPLLISLNNLLDYNQKILADYSKAEISMKKMLSNISHDIKTPLTVVLGYIETMSLDCDMASDERKTLLLKLESKTKEVLELINKFFNLAKLESGDRDITISRVNANEICRKNILAFYDILSNKRIEVAIEIPDNIIYVRGNEDAIDRILNNLISNSINYGYEGQVIGLSLKSDNDYAYIEVWDRGKGISEIHKDRVFERMYTLEDSRNKLYQGSGLGLTITKRLVEKLGGEISLESEPYERTSFTVKLKKVSF